MLQFLFGLLFLLCTVAAAVWLGILIKGRKDGAYLVWACIILMTGISTLRWLNFSGAGNPIDEAYLDEVVTGGEIYMLYATVKHPKQEGYDVLIGERGGEAHWWHVGRVPDGDFKGLVEAVEPVDDVWHLVRLELPTSLPAEKPTR